MSLNMQKLKKLRDKSKQARSDAVKRGKKNKATQGYNPPLDWDKIEEASRFSFNPPEEQREIYKKILKRKSLKREKLYNVIQKSYQKLYTSYRKALLRSVGKEASFYSIRECDKKHCLKSAILCIQNDITPVNLFRFWHNRTVNFNDGSMKVPHLGFLSSEYSVTTAAKADSVEIQKPAEKVIKAIFGNEYSELNRLDPRVRKTLRESKHGDLQYSNRELLSVQVAARALATGSDIFIDEEIYDAAKYLADTIYKGIGK